MTDVTGPLHDTAGGGLDSRHAFQNQEPYKKVMAKNRSKNTGKSLKSPSMHDLIGFP